MIDTPHNKTCSNYFRKLSLFFHKMSGEYFGPPLPSHLAQKSEKRFIGPALPLKKIGLTNPESEANKAENCETESPEQEEIGPKPAENDPDHDESCLDVFLSKKTKVASLKTSTDGLKREEWMTTPPEALASTTPAQKRAFRPEKRGPNPEAVEKEPKKSPLQTHIEKQARLDEQVEQYMTETRSHSLIEQKKKLTKEQEKEGNQQRRPFDREVDLQIPKPGASDSTKMASDAVRALGSRFSSASDNYHL